MRFTSGSIITAMISASGSFMVSHDASWRSTSRVPRSAPFASRIVITACQPAPLPRFSTRPSTETSAAEADTNTCRPSRSSTLRASACVAMQASAPGMRSHDNDDVRPGWAAALLAKSSTLPRSAAGATVAARTREA